MNGLLFYINIHMCLYTNRVTNQTIMESKMRFLSHTKRLNVQVMDFFSPNYFHSAGNEMLKENPQIGIE